MQDIEIARNAELLNISEIAKKLDIQDNIIIRERTPMIKDSVKKFIIGNDKRFRKNH